MTDNYHTPHAHLSYFRCADVLTYEMKKNECCKNHLFCFILFHVICADGIICFEKRQ